MAESHFLGLCSYFAYHTRCLYITCKGGFMRCLYWSGVSALLRRGRLAQFGRRSQVPPRWSELLCLPFRRSAVLCHFGLDFVQMTHLSQGRFTPFSVVGCRALLGPAVGNHSFMSTRALSLRSLVVSLALCCCCFCFCCRGIHDGLLNGGACFRWTVS